MPPYQISRTILFGDCDPAGAIYTPRVAHIVVETALEYQSFLLGSSTVRKMERLGIRPPARSLTIDFLAPLTYDDQIDLIASVQKVGRTSFTSQIKARRSDGEIAFSARISQVCVELGSLRPVQIPAELRAVLESHCDA